MDPLSQLKDIQLPGPVPFWPPAPGWLMLALIVFLGLLYLLYLGYRLWQKKAAVRLAVKQLQARHLHCLEADHRTEYAREINILMKQVALNYHPANQVAGLSGNSWLAFLDVTGKTTDFTQGPASMLGSAPYGDNRAFDIQAVHQCCLAWVRKQA